MPRTISLAALFILVVIPAGVAQTSPQADKSATDLQGDPLRPGSVLRLGTTRLRHTTWVTSVALSPDDKTIASADYEGTVRLWELASGREVRTLPVKVGSVVAFSPDGKLLATGGYYQQELRLWNVATSEKVREIPVNARSFAFAPDGTTLVSTSGTKVVLWDVSTGKALREFVGHQTALYSVAVAPDGKTIASGGGGDGTVPQDTAIRLWDAQTGKELRQLAGHKGWVYGLSFSREGKQLASADAYAVHLWDPATGKELHRLDDGPSNQAVFSPKDSKLITAGPLKVYSSLTGKPACAMEGTATAAYCVAVARDGSTIVSGNRDGRVQVWNGVNGKEIALYRGHQGEIAAVAFSPDGSIIASTCSSDRTLRVWGTASGAPLRSIPLGCTTEGHWCKSDGKFLAFSTDGRTVLTGTCDGVIHLHELATGKSREVKVAERWLSAYALSPDGKLVAAGVHDGSRAVVKLVDLSTGQEVRRWQPYAKEAGYDARVSSLGFSPDGKLLAVGSINTRIIGPRGELPKYDTILLHDTASGELVRSFRRVSNAPSQLAFWPDGKTLAAAATGQSPLQLWETATGTLVAKLPNAGGDPFAISADGKYLTFPAGNDIVLWEVLTSKEVQRLRGHGKPATALTFAPDGKSLVSASADSTLLLWKLPPGGPQPKPVNPPALNDMEQAWHQLGDRDPLRAHAALGTFMNAGNQAVQFLGKQLKPAKAGELRPLPQLIAELGDARQADLAASQLCQHGVRARTALFEALRDKLSLEVRKKLELVLAAIDDDPIHPDELRRLRAVQVLERIGTPVADALLKDLASGDSAAQQTLDAQAALQRSQRWRQLPRVVVLSDESVARLRLHLVGNREPRKLAGHTGPVRALVFAADGQTLVSAGLNDFVLVWEASSGKQLRQIKVTVGAVHGIALSPDGKVLATTAEEGSIKLWDPATGELRQQLRGHEKMVVAVAFAPDGKRLASADYGGVIRGWELGKADPVFQIQTKAARTTAVAFAPDGKTLASAGLVQEQNGFGGGIRYSQPAPVQLWDAATGKAIATLSLQGSEVRFSNDGRALIASGNFTLIERNHQGPAFMQIGDESCFTASRMHWWDLGQRREYRTWQGKGAAVVFSADGSLVASVGGHDAHYHTFQWGSNTIGTGPEAGQALRLWEACTGKEIVKRPLPSAALAVTFAPDGRTLAWSDERGAVFLWDLSPLQPLAHYASKPSAADLAELWNDLVSEDAAVAYQAQWTLTAAGHDTVAFFQARLQPAKGPDGQQVARLLADLDSPQFAIREAAMKELETFGNAVEMPSIEALRANRSPEFQRRVEDLLRIMRTSVPPEELRQVRAIRVLERIASAEARQLLKTLADGTRLSRVTVESRNALSRLANR